MMAESETLVAEKDGGLGDEDMFNMGDF